MDTALLSILDAFSLAAAPVDCLHHRAGHINSTYIVTVTGGRRYILQRISGEVFKNIPAMMQNIRLVTEFLQKSISDRRQALCLVPTKQGENYLYRDGDYWRMYDFVENSLCLLLPESDEDLYQSALGFGGFLDKLDAFPIEQLAETIPNFHNTPDRYRTFREVLERDPLGRAAGVKDEIGFALAREEEMSRLQQMRDAKLLPTRVTHNDTKLSNILLDADTRKALCVIDLDTVMPGLSLYDFGDSIRSGASTAAEDERNLDLVQIDLQRFRIYTRGFLRSFKKLTEKEIELLPLGAKVITFENGLRFLTDYIDGDHYFAISRDTQNLDRTRAQFKLVSDMESKWEEMQRIVAEEKAALL